MGGAGWPWARSHKASPSQKKRSLTRGFPCAQSEPAGQGTERSWRSFTRRPPRASRRAPLRFPALPSPPIPHPRLFTADKDAARERCPPPGTGCPPRTRIPSSLLFLTPSKSLITDPTFRPVSRPEGMTPCGAPNPTAAPQTAGLRLAPTPPGSGGARPAPGSPLSPRPPQRDTRGRLFPASPGHSIKPSLCPAGAWGGAAAAPRLSSAL